MEVMNKWLQRGPTSTIPALINALGGIQEHTIAASLLGGNDSCYYMYRSCSLQVLVA